MRLNTEAALPDLDDHLISHGKVILRRRRADMRFWLECNATLGFGINAIRGGTQK
jgi:hypothetical protein